MCAVQPSALAVEVKAWEPGVFGGTFAVGEIGCQDCAICAGSVLAVEIVTLGSLGRRGTHQAVLGPKSPSQILNSDLLPIGASAWLFAGAFNSPLSLLFFSSHLLHTR